MRRVNWPWLVPVMYPLEVNLGVVEVEVENHWSEAEAAEFQVAQFFQDLDW